MKLLQLFKRKNKYKKRYPKADIAETAYIDKKCEIGDYTFIGRDVDITVSKIGNYCSIANHVRIGQGEHAIDEISTNARLSDKNDSKYLVSKPLVIGHDVWIGVDAIIRRGVTIGTGAVIGANSFVNKDVPEFAVVAGIPAKIIKYRFDEKTRENILASKYWEYPPEQAREILARLVKENNLA